MAELGSKKLSFYIALNCNIVNICVKHSKTSITYIPKCLADTTI